MQLVKLPVLAQTTAGGWNIHGPACDDVRLNECHLTSRSELCVRPETDEDSTAEPGEMSLGVLSTLSCASQRIIVGFYVLGAS